MSTYICLLPLRRSLSGWRCARLSASVSPRPFLPLSHRATGATEQDPRQRISSQAKALSSGRPPPPPRFGPSSPSGAAPATPRDLVGIPPCLDPASAYSVLSRKNNRR